MIKICTVYFEGMYSPNYVTNLYRSLKKHATVPFEFVCLSDTDAIEADVILPYNQNTYIKLHWHKLKYFSQLFADQSSGDEIIVMDIDQLIVANIDAMLTYPVGANELVSYQKWWDVNPTPPVTINGGWYKFRSGALNCVWNKFIENPEYWQLHFTIEMLCITNTMVNKTLLKWFAETIKSKSHTCQVNGWANTPMMPL